MTRLTNLYPSSPFSPWVDRAEAFVAPGDNWPRAIKHRAPEAIDGDRKGNVQVLTSDGWELARWDDVVPGKGWQHTPSWKLPDRAAGLLTQLVLLVGSRQPITTEIQQLVSGIRKALAVLP
jgi:hypothetical protein